MDEDIYLLVCCLGLIVFIWLANGHLADVSVLDQAILGVD